MAYYGDQYNQHRKDQRSRTVLLVALVALMIVALALCGGIYFLFRNGAFDTLLGREETGEPTGIAFVPSPTEGEPQPTASPHPTAPLIVTATRGLFATTPPPTRAPTATATPTLPPPPQPSATPTKPDPLAGKYLVEYLGCERHGSGVGTVKGRILDRQGNVIAGAEVRVTLNGWQYDTPVKSNEAGWYEFYLDKGLKVKIESLRIQGREMPLIGNEDLEVKSQAGCFEWVNLRQQ